MEERLNKKKDGIQRKAVEQWITNGRKGTCEIITGLGKTFIGLHCLASMPNDDGKVHLFLAETTGRERDLKVDLSKYNKIFGRNLEEEYDIQFYCYQTVYKWENRDFGLIIADEIHDSLSPAYSQFYFNNTYDAIIGLSATITRNTWYEDENGKKYSKGKLLDTIAPVVFKYDMSKGQEDNTSRKLDIYVIGHQLDTINKTVKSGSKKNPFMQTEKAAYDYWDNQFKRSLYINDEEKKSFRLRITSHKRSRILYDMKSKIPIIKKILPTLQGKTILFGNSLDRLYDITKNVVSSRNTDDLNEKIRDEFEKGKINLIGSFKKLKQGANLKGVDNCLIMSFYSTEKDLIQRLGRLRKKGEKIGTVIILVTQGTKEMDWYTKMFENMHDTFQVQYFMNVDQYIAFTKILQKNNY